MSLKTWIRKTGTRQVAELLGVETATVRYWRRGESWPRIEQMRKIKRITKGVVGYEQMIEGSK